MARFSLFQLCLVYLSGRDVNSEPCQRFFRDGLTTSFIRILTDDAVSTWKADIQVSISLVVSVLLVKSVFLSLNLCSFS